MKYLGFVLFLLFSSNPAVAKMGALFDPDGTGGGDGTGSIIVVSLLLISFFINSNAATRINIVTFIALLFGFMHLGFNVIGGKLGLIVGIGAIFITLFIYPFVSEFIVKKIFKIGVDD
jgi:hypothetical protein